MKDSGPGEDRRAEVLSERVLQILATRRVQGSPPGSVVCDVGAVLRGGSASERFCSFRQASEFRTRSNAVSLHCATVISSLTDQLMPFSVYFSRF